MFVLRIKLKKSRLIIIICAAVAVLVFALIVALANADYTPVKNYATCDEAGEYSLSAGTRQEQADFLKQFGYEARTVGATSDKVTIPTRFNEVYEKYNALQKEIGLDLTAFKGKTVERVRLELADGTNRQAVMLVYKNKVIAAHITSGIYGDENQPLV